MADLFVKNQRVVLGSDPSCTGYIVDIVYKEISKDQTFYIVQWDKYGRYNYPEEMLTLEPKENKK